MEHMGYVKIVAARVGPWRHSLCFFVFVCKGLIDGEGFGNTPEGNSRCDERLRSIYGCFQK